MLELNKDNFEAEVTITLKNQYLLISGVTSVKLV